MIHKPFHQQSFLLNDTDNTRDEEDHIYSRIPKPNSNFITDNSLHEKNFSTIKNQSVLLHQNKPRQ